MQTRCDIARRNCRRALPKRQNKLPGTTDFDGSTCGNSQAAVSTKPSAFDEFGAKALLIILVARTARITSSPLRRRKPLWGWMPRPRVLFDLTSIFADMFGSFGAAAL